MSGEAACTRGLVHVFNGYRSCALDAQPCATKVLDSPGTSIDECISQCGDMCEAISLFESRECWVYSALRGDPVGDDRSVYCARAQPPPPSPPPPPPPPPPPTTTAASAVLLQSLKDKVSQEQQLSLQQLQQLQLLSQQQQLQQQLPSLLTPPSGAGSSRQEAALLHLQNAQSSLGAAGGALIAGVPVPALVALAVGGLIGLLLLLAGCLLMGGGRRRRRSLAAAEVAAFGADAAEGGRAVSQGGGFANGGGGGGGGSMPLASQRVLVEIDGEVTTKRLRTSHCKSVRQLRLIIAEACADLAGAAESTDMLLEYLDEQAGLAITVSSEAQLRTVLSKPTLKATFTSRPRGGRPSMMQAVNAARSGRRRGGKAGYERAGAADSEDEEEMDQPRSGCSLM